ncbi:hypothetical protein [Pseudomonas sp. JUb52]|uniref:hypothetical protein n=1 Tax=Pseudomonas sp. JUb52 TaxID=2485127 RepID=UPI00104E2B9D|nr:hypothetical protein [Pseudomonas sp. JUb52]TCQ84237.1 hypothetical protein EC839_113111 [Pseudomonas sp. JUb52]
MTFADKLRELIKQPQGDKKVQEYIKQVLNDPNTRCEIAEISNEYESYTQPASTASPASLKPISETL